MLETELRRGDPAPTTFSHALAACTQSLDVNPDRADAHERLASLHWRWGDVVHDRGGDPTPHLEHAGEEQLELVLALQLAPLRPLLQSLARHARELARTEAYAGREAEFRANRFAGELTVPFEDFWPRFCDSGLSVAAMGQHYRQSEHVIARQAKLTLAEICPMAIFVCPVVKPREDGILEYVAKGVSTQVVQVFDRQHSDGHSWFCYDP